MTRLTLLILTLVPLWPSAAPAPAWWRKDNTHITLLRMQGQVYSSGMLLVPDVNLVLRLGPHSNSYFGFYGDYAIAHRPAEAVRKKYPFIEQQTWHAGASFIRKHRTGWHFHSTLSILRGEEEYSTTKEITNPGNPPYQRTTTFLLLKGYDMTLGTFFSRDDIPVLFGIEFFFRQSNSVLMGTGMGLKVNVGFRF